MPRCFCHKCLCYYVVFKDGLQTFELFFYAWFMLLRGFQGDCTRLNYFCIPAFKKNSGGVFKGLHKFELFLYFCFLKISVVFSKGCTRLNYFCISAF